MLGDLSAKYESSGSPATISSGEGDPGGKSYGKYQLASRMGSVDSFLKWAVHLSANAVYASYGRTLSQFPIGSADFDCAWREIARIDAEGFERMQHDYVCYAYYLPAVEELRSVGFAADKHTHVMQDVIWSRTVQYGTGNIVEMFETACHRMYNEANDDYSGYPNLSYVDDARFDYDLIHAIYLAVCKTPEWTTPLCRRALYERFESECAEALAMLGSA